MIGSIFYLGDKIVEDEKEGTFDKEKAKELIGLFDRSDELGYVNAKLGCLSFYIPTCGDISRKSPQPLFFIEISCFGLPEVIPHQCRITVPLFLVQHDKKERLVHSARSKFLRYDACFRASNDMIIRSALLY